MGGATQRRAGWIIRWVAQVKVNADIIANAFHDNNVSADMSVANFLGYWIVLLRSRDCFDVRVSATAAAEVDRATSGCTASSPLRLCTVA